MDFLGPFFKGNNHSIVVPSPSIDRWITSIMTEESLPYAIALGFASATTAIVVILAFVHLYFVVKYITDETVRSDMYWIVLMCPITTVCGLVGMFVPRSATFLNAVALAYLMLCLFVMVTLMNSLFGGRKSLSEYLTERGEVIRINVFPICCCKCLPTFRPTEANLRRIEWTVFQTPLIRMCLEIMNMVVFLELNHRQHWWFQASNMLGLSSMFLAFYGCYVMTPLGNARLAQFKFKTIFRLVDIAQALFSFQKFSFDFLAAIGFFEEGPILPSLGKAQFITSSMLSWEMLLISIMATYLLRPSTNSVFDKYHLKNSASPSPQSGSQSRITPELPPVRPPPSKNGIRKCEMMRCWSVLLVFIELMVFGLATVTDDEMNRYRSIIAQNKAWDASCDVIQRSKNARLISSNVDEGQRESALYAQTTHHAIYDDIHFDIESAPPNKKSLYDKVQLRLKLGRYAEHICDAKKFRPYVKELGMMSFTCSQMCYKCFPGSFAVCYVKNRMFPGVAQTCLCSYDKEQPINRAAFSLKQGGVIMPNLVRFHD